MANQRKKQTIKKEGNLEKKSRYLGVWRKRWTVLAPQRNSQRSVVSTYKKPKQYKSPTECIRIDNKTNIRAFPDKDDKNEVLFYIENTNDKDKFCFRAESKRDRDEWIKSITNANKKQDKTDLRNIINGTQQQQQQQPSNDEIKLQEENKLIDNKNIDNKSENKETENTSQNNAQKIDSKNISDDTKQNETVSEAITQEVQKDDQKQKEEVKPNENITQDTESQPATEEKQDIKPAEIEKEKDSKVEIKEDEQPKTETIIDNNENTKQEIINNEQANDEERKDDKIKPQQQVESSNVNDDVEVQNEEPPQSQPEPEQEKPKEDEPQPQVDVEPSKPEPEQKEDAPQVDAEASKPESEAQVDAEAQPQQQVDDSNENEQVSQPKEEQKEVEAKSEETETEADNTQVEEEYTETQEETELPQKGIEAPKTSQAIPEINDNVQINNQDIVIEEEKQKQIESQETEVEPPKQAQPIQDTNEKPPPPQPEPEQKEQQAKEEVINEVEVSNENDNVQNEQSKEEVIKEEENDNVQDEQNELKLVTETSEPKQSGLSAAIAAKDEEHDKFSVEDVKKTLPKTPVAIEHKSSDPEESMSQASSYRSDDGDAPFGKRWGFDMNDTMDDEAEINENEEENKENEIDIDTSNMEYSSVVIIGNNKSGKTTLLNRLLGNDNKDDEKYQQTNDNVIRNKVFMSGGDSKEEEKGDDIICSFVDTSGDMSNIQKTICGISISDITIILISIAEDKFDGSLDELKEFVRVLNTYRMEKYICCLSNIDSIDYNQEKYELAQGKVEKMFKKIGIKAKKIAFVPVNCKDGDNICEVSKNEKLGWYKGWTLKKKTGMTVVDAIRTITIQSKAKKTDKAFIMPVNVRNDVISGKIEQGMINKGDKVRVASNDEMVSIVALKRSGQVMENGKQGDYVSIEVVGSEVVSGDVLYMDNENKLNIKPCKSITALVVVSGIDRLEVGFEGIICVRANTMMCTLSKIRKGDKEKSDVEFLGDKEQGEVVLTFKEGVIASTFDECESLGRFVVIKENKPVLVGKIESVSYYS